MERLNCFWELVEIALTKYPEQSCEYFSFWKDLDYFFLEGMNFDRQIKRLLKMYMNNIHDGMKGFFSFIESLL